MVFTRRYRPADALGDSVLGSGSGYDFSKSQTVRRTDRRVNASPDRPADGPADYANELSIKKRLLLRGCMYLRAVNQLQSNDLQARYFITTTCCLL